MLCDQYIYEELHNNLTGSFSTSKSKMGDKNSHPLFSSFFFIAVTDIFSFFELI